MRIYQTEFGQFMLAANVSVIMIAKKCKVGKKTVYNWINKVHIPNNIKTLNTLSELLNVAVDDLIKYFKKD